MVKYKDSSLAIDVRTEDLLSKMTFEEKMGQLCQSPMLDYGSYKALYLDKVRKGKWGSRILADTAWAGNAPGESVDPNQLNEIQKAAIEESRLGIPIIFARDVIYGQKTVLPIPLAQACSWNPLLVEEAYRGIAAEAASLGINWTFAPMLDIVRDPRWGRVIESSGEDPHLTSQMAKGVVRGFQGDDLTQPENILACAKHFVGYGASEGGRDYDTTEISENSLHNVYLPPFKAAINAGVGSLMTGFNDLGGTPVTGSKPLVRDWLRGQQGFDGLVVSDWGSISDLEYFGVAKDSEHAAALALEAGVDMAMTHEAYEDNLALAIERNPELIAELDDAVRNVLRAKFRLGLFERPYVDPKHHLSVLGKPEHANKALALAEESLVLLKNDNDLLPLADSGLTVAVIGPHADSQRQHLGSWCLDGSSDDVVSIIDGLRAQSKQNTIITDSVAFSDDMVECAHRADVVVLCIGESHRRTGEARNVADLALPAGQEQLISAIGKTGKPLIVVQCTGRPIPSPAIEQHGDALVYAWQSGTQTGNAVARILYGLVNPSGKLSMSVPRSTGQIPIYYARKELGKMRAYQDYQPYKDCQDTPLYPFGFGLSYSRFSYSDLKSSKPKVSIGEEVHVSVAVTNDSEVDGCEVIQCYISQKGTSTTRPRRELKAFKKVDLKAFESKTIEFTLTTDDFAFYGKKGTIEQEAAKVTIFVGGDSNSSLQVSIDVLSAQCSVLSA
ncbi:glycoside hydrolase family 3 N-terminal domain-containing protein [Vibrio breoganii]|uniref:glycoside hydrolase family 3 N-terminal domain-containing protein n=1 Tax=Vibrio breoganii TaxID=553239 RepID=UPI000C826530|nr:glycoside hydrolase family 3 N-terminal domain-containing protein [Vibrio breoganii]PMO33076.1 beta-glucosidase [Vibrio breoganii]PMO58499.1 beta-glucosidase [Vibrio breoganii]